MAAATYCDGPKSPWALLSPEGTYHKLKEPSFFVGRNGDVDLTLKSRSVDKKHAVITIQEEQELLYIHDLDSLNGTFVNERRIQKSKLGLGDTVRFGYDMNIYRIDLYPCKESKLALFDQNNNGNSCYKRCNDMYHHVEEPKKFQGLGSKTCDSIRESRPDTVLPGSKLYGQPSWWGWGSSDEEVYTYPNCATVVSQSGATQCTVLQQQIKRNKANLEPHHTVLKKPTTTKPARTPTTAPVLTTRNVQEFSNIYNIPVFGAWENVPHGSYVEGLEEDSLDSDSCFSKDSLSFIPIVPDFGELPEKPVSEKSRKVHKMINHLDSSPSSSLSENSDFDYSHNRGVFGLTEVTHAIYNSPKGVKAGKPKHQPVVKMKSSNSKPSSPRNEKSRGTLRRNSSASSATKESPSKPSHVQVSSSGGSSIPSDNESRGSGQTPITSTSDDSDGEHSVNSPNSDKDNKLEDDKSKSLTSPREVYSDATDKGSWSSSLPRVNKTALLRARNSREASKSTGRRSSPLRSRATAKPRHRRSNSSKENHPTDLSLRIWSPSNKKLDKSPSQESAPVSSESSVSSSVSSSSLGDGAQPAIDAIFEAGTPGSYTLPQELQMNRNDSNNRTFVLEDKKEEYNDVAKTPDSSASNHKWISSMEDTLETLHLSFANDEKTSKLHDTGQATRPLTRPPQPDDWVASLSNKLRCGSPESLVSVPPASSPSPPSSPRSTARHLIQERLNCSSAPPHSRRQWDITDKPVEDLMLSSVHAFTVELRLASELVLSKARNLYETSYTKDTERLSDKEFSNAKKDSKIPEWKSSHAEIAGVFRNLRRVEFNLRTMDQALSYLCSAQDCQDGHKTSFPSGSGMTPKRWKEIQARARKFSWAEVNRCKFPGPPSDDEEVAT